MVPGQEANSNNLGDFFFDILYVECSHYNRLDEAIIMSTHNKYTQHTVS